MRNQAVVVLDREEFKNQSTDIQVGGTKVTASSSSPYDIPEAVQSYRNEQKGIYTFEVKYIGPDEPTDTVSFGKDIEIRAGRNSKRIYAITVHPADPHSKTSVLNTIRVGVSQLQAHDGFPRKDNYRMVDNAFLKVGDRVLDMLMFGETGPIRKAAG